MLRRLHPDQPESFAFTPANLDWARGQIAKYPEGRQASAVIPLLWRAQEQEGWVTRPAIEEIARMLGMAYIRVLEVATFYFMFQLQPVGSIAHVQVCGTTSCMICGAEDLIAVCREKIAPSAHAISADGKFSWEEVECLGACSNAPMVQIGKDYYEDLTAESFAGLLDAFARGEVPQPGPQNGRYASEPKAGLTSLKGKEASERHNGSVALALALGDTVARITGEALPAQARQAPPEAEAAAGRPEGLSAPRGGAADDLKKIKGVGPKLEELLHSLGFYHFEQIAGWTREEVAWVDENLEGFKGRVTRDDWVEQARKLAAGEETEFSQRVDKGEVY
ncbi:MAG TPA: NADH-quinone oxidoreductase subunit NuoE [Amaricoccus sp.]|uniref:NADH-quinone oxidoreductase subunit NuoE n=1 Tax=Amaricoccus sp. TaxID=1872485 RepID=UPI002D103450|nr:NADH-quinone oxidoreductase subunit NuoE [Amaricoccus sp.]HMQ93753.1 NADH-quinone oxidoreductase subunit NuoE [Amaricoccus sp.]HMR53587.1 NADH-quinone oxidoreductase subunit NuoE [Amaricoccus sp.]HMR61735.1 NADH-quinone oxidoreductase subunit NuoE [Amaricoccus sp.]HMU00598.1 NADH-quinone oxidoreductase subunit NuoE [Amaricoccus sp.]